MFFLLVFSITASMILVIQYLWFLSWPRVSGKVIKVNEGINSQSVVRSPYKYRLLVFEYSFSNKNYLLDRQGLFITHALAIKKLLGDDIVISVCEMNKNLSCPFRPVYEFFVLSICILIISMPYMLLRFL